MPSSPAFQTGLQERRVLQQALMRRVPNRFFQSQLVLSGRGALLAAWLGAES